MPACRTKLLVGSRPSGYSGSSSVIFRFSTVFDMGNAAAIAQLGLEVRYRCSAPDCGYIVARDVHAQQGNPCPECGSPIERVLDSSWPLQLHTPHTTEERDHQLESPSINTAHSTDTGALHTLQHGQHHHDHEHAHELLSPQRRDGASADVDAGESGAGDGGSTRDDDAAVGSSTQLLQVHHQRLMAMTSMVQALERGLRAELDRLTHLHESMAPSETPKTPAAPDVIARLPKRRLSAIESVLHPGPCAVCLDALTDQVDVTRLPCGHLFHDAECLSPWLQERSTCPVCRCVLTSDAVEASRAAPFLSTPTITPDTIRELPPAELGRQLRVMGVDWPTPPDPQHCHTSVDHTGCVGGYVQSCEDGLECTSSSPWDAVGEARRLLWKRVLVVREKEEKDEDAQAWVDGWRTRLKEPERSWKVGMRSRDMSKAERMAEDDNDDVNTFLTAVEQ